MIQVACVSDVHSPKYLDLFRDALAKIDVNQIDLFLLGGDMIYKGNVDQLNNIILELERASMKFPIYSCFGNEEFDNLYDQLREIGKNKIIFLEDELVSIKRKNKPISIIGTKGSLAQPTWWQDQNIPKIREIYKERIERIRELVSQLKDDLNILLFHYAPTYLTVLGEPSRAHAQMGTRAYEEVIFNRADKISAVFHGHAHKGRKFVLFKNRIPIYNIAFPLRKEITVVNLPRPPSRGSLFSYIK